MAFELLADLSEVDPESWRGANGTAVRAPTGRLGLSDPIHAAVTEKSGVPAAV